MTPLRAILLLLLGMPLIGCSTFFESDNQAPPADLTDYEPRIEIQTLWSRDTGAGNGGQALRLVPAYHDGKLFVADYEGQVHALNASNGESIWRIDTEAPISGGPGIDDGRLFLGTRRAEIIALAESDGKELWRTSVGSEVIAVPKATKGTVVVHTVDGRLYGLNAETGKRKWVYSRNQPALTLRGSSTPFINQDTVTVGLSGGALVSLQLATGEPQWEIVVTQPRGRSELERIADIDASPVLQDGLLFVATYQGEVAGISPETGVVIWHRKLSTYADLAADWRQLYVSDAVGKVWALDLRGGSALWQQDALLHRRLTAPAIIGDYVLVGDLDGYIHWLAADDGALQARERFTSAALTAPALVVDEVAYWYADNGKLAALSLVTKKVPDSDFASDSASDSTTTVDLE